MCKRTTEPREGKRDHRCNLFSVVPALWVPAEELESQAVMSAAAGPVGLKRESVLPSYAYPVARTHRTRKETRDVETRGGDPLAGAAGIAR